MRDRDAIALARDAHAQLEKLCVVLGPARARLRDWSDGGMPRSGEGGGNTSQEYPDPVARAVQASEIVKNGRRVGWRATDPHAHRLRELDKELGALRSTIVGLVEELDLIVAEPEVIPEEGCELCDSVRLPTDALGQMAHRCDKECAARDHRHPANHQDIYSRRAPHQPDYDPDNPDGPPALRDRPRCKWHYDFARRHGKDSNLALSLWHLDNPTRRPPSTLLRQHNLNPDTDPVTV